MSLPGATPGTGTTARPRTDAPRSGAASGRGGPPRWSQSWFDDRVLPWLLLAPAILLIFGLILYPVGRTFWLSFHDAGLQSVVSGAMDFVGLDNYVDILTEPRQRRVFYVTAIFGFSAVIATMLLGLAVALLLNRKFKGRALLAVLVLLPWAMPRVAAATVWRWMFNDQYGVVNWGLNAIGLSQFDGFAWFNDVVPAFIAIGITVVWQAFPFVALSLLAGLQSIPEDVIDATHVDGANGWQRLRHVILPMLKPLLLVLVVISTIWDFKVFDQVFVMTGGGPARKTEVLSIATWREAFTQLDFGVASSFAMLMFVILVVITLIYIRLIRDEEGLG